MIFKDILKDRITESSDTYKIKGTDIVCKTSDGKSYTGPSGSKEFETIQKWFYEGELCFISTMSNDNDPKLKVVDPEMGAYLLNDLFSI